MLENASRKAGVFVWIDIEGRRSGGVARLVTALWASGICASFGNWIDFSALVALHGVNQVCRVAFRTWHRLTVMFGLKCVQLAIGHAKVVVAGFADVIEVAGGGDGSDIGAGSTPDDHRKQQDCHSGDGENELFSISHDG